MLTESATTAVAVAGKQVGGIFVVSGARGGVKLYCTCVRMLRVI